LLGEGNIKPKKRGLEHEKQKKCMGGEDFAQYSGKKMKWEIILKKKQPPAGHPRKREFQKGSESIEALARGQGELKVLHCWGCGEKKAGRDEKSMVLVVISSTKPD